MDASGEAYLQPLAASSGRYSILSDGFSWVSSSDLGHHSYTPFKFQLNIFLFVMMLFSIGTGLERVGVVEPELGQLLSRSASFESGTPL